MSLITRRRAVYTGLSGYFAEDELLAALDLWERKYADKPSFALNEYLAELAGSVKDKKLERAKVYRDLVGALTGPVTALSPDPEPLLSRWRQRVQSAVQHSGDAQASQTFEVLVDCLLKEVDAQLALRLRQYAADNLSGFSGTNEQRLYVRVWLEQGVSLGSALLGVSQLRQLLNLLYIGLCEYLGPVVADQRLSHAVRQAESMGLAFAPRQLL